MKLGTICFIHLSALSRMHRMENDNIYLGFVLFDILYVEAIWILRVDEVMYFRLYRLNGSKIQFQAIFVHFHLVLLIFSENNSCVLFISIEINLWKYGDVDDPFFVCFVLYRKSSVFSLFLSVTKYPIHELIAYNFHGSHKFAANLFLYLFLLSFNKMCFM